MSGVREGAGVAANTTRELPASPGCCASALTRARPVVWDRLLGGIMGGELGGQAGGSCPEDNPH